jgi:hypothetical protein
MMTLTGALPFCRIVCSVGFAALLLLPSAAQAQEEPSGVAASGSADSSARLQFIEESFRRGKIPSNIWYFGWSMGQLGAAGLFTTLAVVQRDKPGALPNNIISAAQSLLGATVMFIFPLDSALASRRLARAQGDVNGRLRVAETLLADSARSQRQGRHWINHLLGFVMAATGGLLLTFAFDDTNWVDGLINFGVGMVISELVIWTQPTRAIRDEARYRQKFGAAPEVVVVVPALGGFALFF